MARAKRQAVTIEGRTGRPDPAPPKIKLNEIEDVRREMATIYRMARAGKMDVTDVGKLAYVLSGIGKLIEMEQIERRISALETMQRKGLLK